MYEPLVHTNANPEPSPDCHPSTRPPSSLSPGPDPEPDPPPPALTLNLTMTLASYHRECFKCAACNKPLYVGFTIGEDGGTYCRQCQR